MNFSHKHCDPLSSEDISLASPSFIFSVKLTFPPFNVSVQKDKLKFLVFYSSHSRENIGGLFDTTVQKHCFFIITCPIT